MFNFIRTEFEIAMALSALAVLFMLLSDNQLNYLDNGAIAVHQSLSQSPIAGLVAVVAIHQVVVTLGQMMSRMMSRFIVLLGQMVCGGERDDESRDDDETVPPRTLSDSVWEYLSCHKYHERN
jgi:hypothetical protein